LAPGQRHDQGGVLSAVTNSFKSPRHTTTQQQDEEGNVIFAEEGDKKKDTRHPIT
jgi:hypothetical protein